MDFHLDNLLNLPNVVADSYSSTLDAIVVKLQLVKELTVKQVSENEKMSEDAVQDIFHKVASSKKSGCALVGFPDGLAHQAKLGIS